jgi:hypothetical protein
MVKQFSQRRPLLTAALCLLPSGFCLLPSTFCLALPPPEEVPEEVLRTEIILDARSPIDGSAISPAEYAELQAMLEDGSDIPPTVSAEVRQLIFLLGVRRFIRIFVPFFP